MSQRRSKNIHSFLLIFFATCGGIQASETCSYPQQKRHIPLNKECHSGFITPEKRAIIQTSLYPFLPEVLIPIVIGYAKNRLPAPKGWQQLHQLQLPRFRGSTLLLQAKLIASAPDHHIQR